MSNVLLTKGKVAVSVLFDTVKIELICGDAYEAQSLYDEVVERLQAGEGLTLGMEQPLPKGQRDTMTDLREIVARALCSLSGGCRHLLACGERSACVGHSEEADAALSAIEGAGIPIHKLASGELEWIKPGELDKWLNREFDKGYDDGARDERRQHKE